MSKISDVDKTDRMRLLLRQKYVEERYSLVEEVGSATGFGCARWADALVQELWPSDGLKLMGFELKASRSDLRHELADLSKHQMFAQYCHRWTLVTWDTAVVGTLEIPEDWAWWSVSPDQERFEVHRKGRDLTPPEALPREFVASLLRKATAQSPCASWMGLAMTQVAQKVRQEAAAEAFVLRRRLEELQRKVG